MVLTRVFVANRIRMSQLFMLLIVAVLAVSESRWGNHLLDALWFVCLGLLELIEAAHMYHAVPTLVRWN